MRPSSTSDFVLAPSASVLVPWPAGRSALSAPSTSRSSSVSKMMGASPSGGECRTARPRATRPRAPSFACTTNGVKAEAGGDGW